MSPFLNEFTMDDDLQDINLHEFLLWLLRFRRRFRVTQNSMLPLLKQGDEVLIDPKAYRHTSPQPGDIVVARRPDRPSVRIIKRVTAITSNGDYILASDNPLAGTDSRTFGPVAMKYILGRVTCRF